MKRNLFFLACIIFSSVLAVNVVNAQSTYRPFGGRVLSTTNPPVICNNTEASYITIQPAGNSTGGPFSTTFGTRRFSYGTLTSSVWVLGWYDTIIDATTCYTQAGPYRIPFETTSIRSFGSSR